MNDRFEKYLKTLPVIPEVAVKILSIAEEKLDISFKELEDIIKVDLATSIFRCLNAYKVPVYSRIISIGCFPVALAGSKVEASHYFLIK